jgi:Asp-tRNA(Asn)/Glu-tRNA(Gln) amidotransferase A subunit family amidase
VLENTAFDVGWMTAGESAAAFASRRASAASIVEQAFARIRARDPLINSFTA